MSASISLSCYFFCGNINIFSIEESDRLCGFATPGPLYFLRGVFIQRTLYFKDGGLFLIGYNESLCNSLYELH